MTDLYRLPDGSGCFTASMPLPKDHWLFKPGNNTPPMLLQCGVGNPHRAKIEQAVAEGVRYALRSVTLNGQDDDFDPDALVQQAIVGVVGYFTVDGHVDSDIPKKEK